MRWSIGVLLAASVAVIGCRHRPDRVVVGIGMASNTHAVVRMAAREINEAGGIDGVPVELAGLDPQEAWDRYNPASVLEWANRFSAIDNLLAVVGHSDSASTLSAASFYNVRGIPHIVTIATNPAITGIGAWTYRICVSDAVQGPTLAEYAVRGWHKRRIAIIFVNDDYGRGLARRFERRVQELGGEIVASVMHRNILQPDDHETIRAALASMKARREPDLIALFQRARSAHFTIPAIRAAGLSADILGSDDLAQQSVIDGVRELSEGLRVSQFYRLDTGNPEAVRFADAYRKAAGRDPDFSEAFAYDAMRLLREAIREGRYTRQGIKAYLDRLIETRAPIRGVGGTYTLGADHDARRPIYIAEVRDRRFQIRDTLPAVD